MKFLTYISTENRIKHISEWIYTIIFALYLTYRALKNTTFDMSIFTNMNNFFMALFGVAVGMQILTHMEDKKNVAIAMGTLIISIVAYNHNEYFEVLILGFLISGAIGVKANRILKIWTVIIGVVIVAAAFAGFCGIIDNYTYISFREYGYRVRGALGTPFPTDSASWILLLIAYIWAAWKKITDETMVIITILAMALFYYYHNGQTAVLCGGILLVFIICDMLLEKRTQTAIDLTKTTDNNNASIPPKSNTLNKAAFWLITISMPLATAMLIVFAKLYGRGSGLAQKVNNIIDNRISESYIGISSYGIKLFGTHFRMYGYGEGSVDNAYKYFYLDSSYINVLVRYGIAIFIIYYLLWVLSAHKALKAGNRRLLLVALLVSVQSVEEHHFASLIYNPLVVMALAQYSDGDLTETNKIAGKKKVAAQLGIILAAGLILTLLIPGLLATVRTKYQLQQLVQESIAQENITNEGVSQEDLTNESITEESIVSENPTQETNTQEPITPQTIIDADSAAVETILKSATAPVYTDVMPTIYYDRFEGFSKDIYFGGDHIRADTCTVLMDSACESNIYFMRGYLYSQISDYTAAYTNDEAVIQALMDAGYHVTGFYSTRKEATVKDQRKAELISLQAGKYTTYWKLHLEKEPKAQTNNDSNVNLDQISESQETLNETGDMASGSVTCTLRVTSAVANTPETIGAQIESGEDGDATTTQELAAVQVLRSDFDDQGNAEMTLIFTRGVEESVKLSVKNEKGYKVLIEKCEYAQTPDYDVHNTINFYGQVVRSEYYDFDGNKVVVDPGYWAVEYGYNENKQIYRLKYYDADNNRVITAYGCWMIEYDYDALGRIVTERYYDTDENRMSLPYGYAELHRSFDEYNRVIREEYYDLNGQLVNNTGGFAIKENKYDEAGQVIEEKLYDAENQPIN